jgi:hypothetical protein
MATKPTFEHAAPPGLRTTPRHREEDRASIEWRITNLAAKNAEVITPPGIL